MVAGRRERGRGGGERGECCGVGMVCSWGRAREFHSRGGKGGQPLGHFVVCGSALLVLGGGCFADFPGLQSAFSSVPLPTCLLPQCSSIPPLNYTTLVFFPTVLHSSSPAVFHIEVLNALQTSFAPPFNITYKLPLSKTTPN